MSGCVNQTIVGEASTVIEALREAGLSVVTAESCTGGLLAACLTHGREASSCFHGAFVAYTKTHKSQVLGVDEGLLRDQGAVNTEVARQMAEGALHRSQAAISVAITGVLGPQADEDGNPPGLVCFGLARRSKPTQVVRCEYDGTDPDSVRERSVLKALELIRYAASRDSDAHDGER